MNDKANIGLSLGITIIMTCLVFVVIMNDLYKRFAASPSHYYAIHIKIGSLVLLHPKVCCKQEGEI
jgi:hypothetical protein